jgi:hypothetical protein
VIGHAGAEHIDGLFGERSFSHLGRGGAINSPP